MTGTEAKRINESRCDDLTLAAAIHPTTFPAMSIPDPTDDLRRAMQDRILVLDGAMGTTIRGYGLSEAQARGRLEHRLDMRDRRRLAPGGDMRGHG